jgi:GDPmannose 4,6-dehydratase
MHLSSGIAYNHESPRRPVEFVTRKVTRAAAAIKLGLQDELRMGDLDAMRDWGFAGDFVEAMWLMLRQERGDDYVLATGRAHSVRDLVDVAFGHVGLAVEDCVVVDPAHVRPGDAVTLVGDPSRARERLGWAPKTAFPDMIAAMVEADLAALGRGASV